MYSSIVRMIMFSYTACPCCSSAFPWLKLCW